MRHTVKALVFLMMGGPAQAQSIAEWIPQATAIPQEFGWSTEGLSSVRQFVDSIGSAAVLIITDNRTIATWGPQDHRFRAHSIRKSFLSALFGIAIAEGTIDTSATLGELGIDDEDPTLTDTERTATVRQLLQARSGVYHTAASETAEMRESRPDRGSHLPGSYWYYNNWDFNALGTIYTQLTGVPVGEAFGDRIATPLGMDDFRDEDVRYQLEPEFSMHAAYKFRISARDLARFGLLFLNGGRREGVQIVSESWIRESTRPHSLTDQSGTKSGYGLMWWVTASEENSVGLPTGSFTASGSRGQRMTVLPGINTVVVHLMDTDDRDGPRIGTSTYNRLLRLLLDARTRPVG